MVNENAMITIIFERRSYLKICASKISYISLCTYSFSVKYMYIKYLLTNIQHLAENDHVLCRTTHTHLCHDRRLNLLNQSPYNSSNRHLTTPILTCKIVEYLSSFLKMQRLRIDFSDKQNLSELLQNT